MVPGNPYIKINAVHKKIRTAEEEHRSLYLHAPVGYGKSAAVEYYYRKKSICLLTGRRGFLPEMPDPGKVKEDVIVVDDISWITDFDSQEYVRMLCKEEWKHAVLLGRSRLPKWLMEEYVSGRILMAEEPDLTMNDNQVAKYLSACGHDLNQEEIRMIVRVCRGYPLGVRMVALTIDMIGHFDAAVLEEARIQCYRYYDSAFFGRWKEDIQRLLLCVTGFDSFDQELAAAVSGNNHVAPLLEYCAAVGDFLCLGEDGAYRLRPLLASYLVWKRELCMKPEEIQEINRRAAQYYYEKNNMILALKRSRMAGDEQMLMRLLVENARRHPGTGHFYETRELYFSLKEEEIMEYPVLIAGMSMLYSLLLQTDKSEEWYGRLTEYIKRKDISREDRREAVGRRAYLDIALPHRGICKLTTIFKSVALLCTCRGVVLPEFSVTSNLPSLMNGGKDFCEWSKRDKELAKIMKVPVETVLGTYGIGLVNIALAESAFEKSSMEDYEIIGLLSSGITQAGAGGKIEMCFAGTGVLVKVHMKHGRTDLAKQALEDMRRRAEAENASQLLSNIRAMSVWIALHEGDMDAVKQWMAGAPDENSGFYILDRYQYMVKLRCCIALEEYDRAWRLAEDLNYYFETYERTYLWIEDVLLRAVISFRLGRPQWKTLFKQAAARAKEYHFIWILAQEGAALKPLLDKAGMPDEDYGAAVREQTKEMALTYPQYLMERKAQANPLTEMERKILRLHCQGIPTKQILSLCEITERTLKFHNTNIYSKLGVKNRREAVEIARKRGLAD